MCIKPAESAKCQDLAHQWNYL